MNEKALSGNGISTEESEHQGNKLMITCFGDFKVIFTETNSAMNWRTKKAKELFAYLIHMQGKPIDRKTLVEKLWLENEEDYNIAVLHNIIYNIRKRLEPYGLRDMIEYEKGSYRIKYDQTFTDLSGMMSVAKAVEDNDLQYLYSHRNILLNSKGRYLENIEGEWVFEWAEYFEVIHIKGCHMMAEDRVKENKPEEAIPYLEVGLKIDMYSEKLAGLLIRCYGELREFKNLKKKYEKYTGILRKDLGIHYSEILESAYRDYIKIGNRG